MQRLLKELMSSRQGSALVFTLLVFAVLMILASAAIAVTGTDSQVASGQQGSKAALYVAESAVDIAKQRIMEDLDAGNTVTGTSISTVPGGEYRYDVIDEGGNKYRIRALGIAKMPNGTKATKTIEVVFKYTHAGGGGGGGGGGPTSVKNVLLNRSKLKLPLGESFTLVATVIPWNADNKDVTWATANPDIAKVKEDPSDNHKAVIEAVALGTTVITVTTVDQDKTATCIVEVIDTPDEPTPPEDPPAKSSTNAFEYAVVGQGSGTGKLQLTGDIKIQGPMHSNSSIHFNNNGNNAGIEVSGPVSTTGEIKIIGKSGDFSGVEMNVGVPPVVMPEINWDYIRQIAATANEDNVYDKDTTLSGDRIHQDDVIFVDGNLKISGEICWNALIVATGDISIEGDHYYPGSEYAAVGFIAGNNIKLVSHDSPEQPGVDGPEIRGFVIAMNNVKTQGEAKITGSLISGNNVEFGSGEIQIVYVEGSDNPVYMVFDIFGTEIIANYDEL